MNTATARAFDNADIAGIIRLSRQVHEQHVAALPGRYREDLDESAAEAFFTDYLTSAGVFSWVTEANTDITGYLSASFRKVPANPFRDAVRQFELDQIVVDEKHRGMGAGKALFEAFQSMATELGADELLVHTLHFNTSAHEFFRRCGFADLSLNMWKPLR